MDTGADYEKSGGKAFYSPPGSDDVTEAPIQTDNVNQLKRNLGNRQIQLIAIGGSIGTALFVSIGSGLSSGGPASLLIAYVVYCCLLGLVSNCMAEMAVYMPISSSFVRMAGHWVDDAFGFMAGWNFFLYEACLIPFEISALNLVLTFWSDNIPAGAIVAACIVLYAILNVFAVKYYGEAEFWLSNGKLLLIGIVFMFTFVTMVGGNPQGDAYGFRYWNNPGAFAAAITTGSLGRFEGFLGSLWSAAFTIVGPEYIAMVAGEAKRPRVYLKTAFKTMYWRFAIFFMGGALCVGIVLPYDDPKLSSAGTKTAAGSPYVIAMSNMGVSVLPHIVNALLVTSIFSAGNAYVYCAMRSLYGMALEGQAPRFLRKCTKQGIPIYCFLITMIFPFLAFTAVSSSSAETVTWLSNLTEAAQLIDYVVMCVTYVWFYRAMKAQGVDRRTLPYRGYLQPYGAYIGIVGMIVIIGCYGYSTFLPGYWDVGTFFSYYTMVFVAVLTYASWKILKKTKVIKPSELDLVWERPQIDFYEANLEEDNVGFWREVGQMIGIGRKKQERPPLFEEEK